MIFFSFICITIFAKVQSDFVVNDVVTFELYTLKNPLIPEILSPYIVQTIKSSNLNRTIPTRFYIHGWQEYGNMRSRFNDG